MNDCLKPALMLCKHTPKCSTQCSAWLVVMLDTAVCFNTEHIDHVFTHHHVLPILSTCHMGYFHSDEGVRHENCRSKHWPLKDGCNKHMGVMSLFQRPFGGHACYYSLLQ